MGSVLRASLNFGPAELVLVRPIRPSLLDHPDFEQMSHGVEDMASRVRVLDTLEEALSDVTASYGFTARARDHRQLRDWREVRSEIVRRAAVEEERMALVFGSEENGLTSAETAPLHELVRIPTSTEHTSINLAVSVALVLSALFFEQAPSANSEGSRPLPGTARQFLVERMKDVLGQQGKSEPARRDIMASVERVFSRAPLETRDARAWHLLVRALGGNGDPRDYGLEGPEGGDAAFVRGDDGQGPGAGGNA